MRVLLLPHNIASQISETIIGLRYIKIDARGMVVQNKIQSHANVEAIPPVYSAQSRLRYLKATPSAIRIFRAILWADVIHWHFEWAMPAALDVLWAKLLKKKIVVEFHGSDIRIPSIEAIDNSYYAEVIRLHPELSDPDKNSIKRQNIFGQAGAIAIVPYPAMLAHVRPNLFRGVYCVLHRIDLDKYVPQFPQVNQNCPNIAHMPSRPLLKGTRYVEKSLFELKNNFTFNYQINSDVTHETATTLIRNCDLYLDQFILGSYGVASVEAMAMGKPVVCYIKPAFKRLYPTDLPIVSTSAEELQKNLRLLIANPQLRYDIGQASRKYAEEHHDTRKVALELQQIYKSK